MAPAGERCLSVVMPCFNEAATIRTVAAKVLASPFTAELIIVDDGSTDGTLELARSLDDPRVRVLAHAQNQGKGAALRSGFAEARAPFVIVQDADLEYDPADFAVMLEPLLEDKADAVYGSRFFTDRPHRVLYFWHSVGNRLLTTVSNMFTNLNLTDMETCYKAFRREVLESFEVEEDRFGFEPEITAKVARGGWRVYEVGISYSGRTYAEGKKIGWKDGLQALVCIARYSGVGSRLSTRRRDRARASRPARFEEADAELAAVLHSQDGARNYNDWIFSMLEPYLGEDVLEVGAGHGTLTERLGTRRRVTATDLSARCIELLRGRYGRQPTVEVRHADVFESAAMGQYDSAVLVNVLEHIEDDEGALRHLATAVRPGGHVLIWVPAFEALYSEFDRRIGHHRRYRADTLAAVVAAAGLEVAEIRYVNTLGAAAWWLVAKKLGRTPTHRRSVRLYDKVVPLLRRVEHGREPPFGQSVFCAARRPLTSVEQGVASVDRQTAVR